MRNLILGVVLGIAASAGVAQLQDAIPDAVTADPKHYSVSF
jgi:hypothetical protein